PDRGDDLVAHRPQRRVLHGRLVGRPRPLRHRGDHLAGFQLPLLAAAVEELDAAVPVQLEVPVGVGGEPVVVAAVEHDRVVVADASLGQQLLEAAPVHEVAADRVLQVLLPVELDGVADMPLVVGAGVLVHLDQDHAWVVEVGFHPVSVHQDVRTAHAATSLSGSGGAAPCWRGRIRRISTYISQPRHRPKAALRKAATNASTAAAIPRGVRPAAYPITPMMLTTRPTPWENRGPAASSISRGGPSRGLTSQR